MFTFNCPENGDIGGDEYDERQDKHGQQTENSVQLFLPDARVKSVRNALVKRFAKRTLQHAENGQLLVPISSNNKRYNSTPGYSITLCTVHLIHLF